MNRPILVAGAPRPRGRNRRGGAVIVVVLALMAMLAFLGLFFYDFVQVEQHTAENFARTTGALEGIDPESLINNAIRQIVTHTEDDDANRGSVLEGGRMSLLAHELGTISKDASGNYVPRDYELRNGRGLSVIKGAGSPFQYAGPDTAPTINTKTVAEFILNRSRAANGAATIDGTYDYEPDVGYTYPDLNGIHIAYDYIPTNSGGANRIIKPSFMDLDLFGNLLESDTSKWYTDASTKRWIFRPHVEHVIPGTTTKRFGSAFPKLTAAALNFGTWTSSGDYAGLDADADNDGNFDSIYMDLGLPPVTLQDGSRTLIPITFWKIEDLNGLIDLNAAGNPAMFLTANRASTVNLTNDIYNLTRSVHYSNYGLTRAEVNPAWALFSDPTSPTAANPAQLRWDVAFYRTTSKNFNLLQLQNTELAMLMLGTSTSMGQSVSGTHTFNDNLDDLQGRFGDTPLIQSTENGPFPAPGTLNVDEDHSTNVAVSEDANENGILDMGEDVNGNGVLDDPLLPRGIHPTDIAGTGSIPLDPATGVRQLSAGAYPTAPMSYPTYTGYWQAQPQPGGSVTTFRSQQVYQSLPATFLQSVFDFRKDDPAEVNRYSYSNIERDNLFQPYEIASLHLGDYDYTRSSLFSRVRQLAPFNFNMTAYARDVRRQFTTESWGRREFVFPYNPSARTFEFNDNNDGQGYRFPPTFGSPAIYSRHELGTPANLDPFRPVVRRLLTTRVYPSGNPQVRNRVYFPQMPLELNRILDDQSGSAAFDSLGNPTFRELTPHAIDEDFDGDGMLDVNEDLNYNGSLETFTAAVPAMVYGNTDPVAVAFGSRFATRQGQEWWAQYDRQRLAQDVFVLLATLCSTNDPTTMVLPFGEDANRNGRLDTGEDTNGNDVLDSPVREMAQFAVNLVDAMDPDDVITRFVYDDNLSDGWNPTGTLYVEGVEAQKLAFNEVLWLKQAYRTPDVTETYHKEDDGHHQFLYVELRNCTPFPVSLQRDSWRIVRLDPTKSDATFNSWDATNHLASAEFRSTSRSVSPGTNFVVASHDGLVVDNTGVTTAADIYANGDASSTFEAIVPTSSTVVGVTGSTTPPPPPQCDLDLCHPDHNGEYQITSTLTGGKLVMFQTSTDTQDATTRMVLSLQRRRNLSTNGHASLNPDDWVEVDRFDFENHTSNTFQLTGGTADVSSKLAATRSKERYHHLLGYVDQTLGGYNDAAVAATARLNLSNHSLDVPGGTRVNTVANPAEPGGQDRSLLYSSLWQPHHDRDFTSVYDLLTVPVCGPDALLQRLHDLNRPAANGGGITGWGNSATSVRYAASTWFMPSTSDTTSVPWTRLLNFLTLPDPTDRVQKNISSQFVQSRTFGKININMIRSPKVLAALLDDTDQIDLNSWTLADKVDTSRQWWTDLKNLRDGTGAIGPGSLNSRPFQDPGGLYGGTEGPGYGVEFGLLRHPYTTYPPATPVIGALEARPQADITTDYVDLHTRHRLLKKLANNTTTRSHMFAIWGGIDFFEGTSVTGGYQVGVKATDVQTCRWFFVVDMTRLEEAYDAKTKSFDWRKFIIYRQRLE